MVIDAGAAEEGIGQVNRPARAGDTDHAPAIDDTDRNQVLAVIREVFANGGGCSRERAIRDVARELGFRRVGPRIRDILDADLRTAVRRGILTSDGGELALLARSVGDYTRDHLADMLLAAMGSAWWERDQAIISAARHLGFRRTGHALRAAFKSAINAAIRRRLVETDGPNRIRRT